MTFRCEEIDDLIGPYALNALQADERVAVLEHLAECRRHDAELAIYQNVVSKLPLTVVPLAPRAGLRGSILSAFTAAATTGAVTPARAAPSGWFAFQGRNVAYGLVAALLLLVIGLVAWNLSLRDEGTSEAFASVTKDGMSLDVSYVHTARLTVLTLDLPPLQSTKSYQAWQITKAGPVSLGLVPSQGSSVLRGMDLRHASAIAISVEPAGGSAQPTTTPVIIAELRGAPKS